ncbi:MAG: glycosyltransferase [Cyanobacteria bacterium P01_A01_bin.17]
MNIAFIVGTFPSLSETFIINQAAGLLERGHQVDIYADQQGNAQKLHPLVEQYGLLDRTTYLSKVPGNLAIRVLKALPLLAYCGVQDPAATLRSLNIFKQGKRALSLWALYTMVPNHHKDYDIVHCQFGTQSYRGLCFQAMHAPEAKLVTTFRGDDISRFVQEKGSHIYDHLFKVGDFFLTNCDFFRDRAIRLGCPPDRIVVHRSGLECDRFPFKSRSLPQQGPIRVATTGRLAEKKGIEYAIRAVAQLIEQGYSLQYSILGDGPLKQPLQELIETLGVTSQIQLRGWQTEDEIIDILAQTHIFIAPSVTAKDGNQDAPINVLKEAMALGIPVISTEHGGIPELVKEGVSGFLVPERDATALAERLRYLCDHPHQWPQMGKAGRAFVKENYSLSQLNHQLVHLYGELSGTPTLSPNIPQHQLS